MKFLEDIQLFYDMTIKCTLHSDVTMTSSHVVILLGVIIIHLERSKYRGIKDTQY